MLPKLKKEDFESALDYVRYKFLRKRALYYGRVDNGCSEVHKLVYNQYFIWLIKEPGAKYVLAVTKDRPADYCTDGVIEGVPVRLYGKLFAYFRDFRKIKADDLFDYFKLEERIAGLLDYPFNLIFDGTVPRELAEEALREHYGAKYRLLKHFVPKSREEVFKKLDLERVSRRLNERSKGVVLKVWKYTVKFRGFRAGSRAYYVAPGSMEVGGVRNIELDRAYIVTFTTGEF